MSQKQAPLASKDIYQIVSKIQKMVVPSRLQKPSNLRPMSAVPLKRKLPSLNEELELPAAKFARTTNISRPIPTKAPLKAIPYPPNKSISRCTSAVSFNKPSKPAVKKWEPRNVVELRKKATGTASQLQSVQDKLKKVEEDREAEQRQHAGEKAELEGCLGAMEMERDDLKGTLKVVKREVTSLKTSLDACNSLKQQLDIQLTTSEALIHQHEGLIASQRAQVGGLEKEVKCMEAQLEGARIQSLQEETNRKKLHNIIQELKGNIRVYGRVRPLLVEEMVGKDTDVPCHMTFPDPNNKILEIEKLPTASANESLAKRGGTSKHEFQFDRVFPPSACQEQVFGEISQLVQSALDGYNVCIFAYGQTGSGKTYTMEGSGVGKKRGVVQRSVEQVFHSVEELAKKGWSYQVEVSFLEIYNESIRDLLGSEADGIKHEIKLVGPNTSEVFVTDLTTHIVSEHEEVRVLLKQASQSRSVAETRCNERSSRSHSVFRMKLTGSNADTSESCCGLLNLVDLAGSERLKESGSQGQRLKETKNINKSLANLSNVIMALANKDAHIPYRNSKLTHLLQNCLGGSAKTLMFVNVSPREECTLESLASLRFATKVNQCNIGVAQKKCK